LLVSNGVVVAGDYDLFAFDATDGTPRWRFHPHDGYGPGYYLGVVADDSVLAGSPSGILFSVDVQSGRHRWSTRVSDGMATVFEPLVRGDVVYVGFTVFESPQRGGIAAFDRSSGREVWRASFSSPGEAFGGGLVAMSDALIATSSAGRVHFLNARDGATTAVVEPTQPDLHDYRPLVVSADTLVVGSLSGVVVAYDLQTRREKWRMAQHEHGSVALAMVADQRSVYVPFLDGRLVALDAQTGDTRWISNGPYGLLRWAPALSGDLVYAAGEGALVALQP
jgi:outer membrane protein assembly factor BamB